MLRHESWKFTDDLCVSPAVARSLSIVIVGAIKVLSTAEVTYQQCNNSAFPGSPSTLSGEPTRAQPQSAMKPGGVSQLLSLVLLLAMRATSG